MTNHPAIIEAGARALNDELAIIASDLEGAEDIPDTMAAVQRCIWHVRALLRYAERHGARASTASVEWLIDREAMGA